jgi:hypothetical protein
VKGKLLKSLSMSRAVAGAVFQRKGLINSTIILAKRTGDTHTMITRIIELFVPLLGQALGKSLIYTGIPVGI